MRIYLVGGALRDRLLDLPVKDRDWVVVGATPGEMLDLGYRQVDAAFPVFLHPQTGEEYALARSETKSGPGYKGFEVECGPQVTLEQDLLRRDLTINAMAEDQQGNIIDPFDGRTDLDNGLLRHVSPAFVEDPVRLLRIARFAVKLGRWGFRVTHATHRLMKQMAASDDITALKPERVWQEMVRALGEPQPWRFFEVLHRCGALQQIMPELAQAMDVPAGHPKEEDSAPIAALKRVAVDGDAPLRFAAVFYHAVVEKGLKTPLLQGLRAEREYRDLLALTLTLAATYRGLSPSDAAGYMTLLQQGGGLQQPQRFMRGIDVCQALYPEEAEWQRQRIEQALKAATAVTAAELLAEGYQGAALGEALAQRRLQAVNTVVA
ncbi:MAG: multifunctional CCA tRNA nucleotidyl transferase/2'3'-cyclic phosphodiesterase/2'nucleotidase/phosphatase [Sedimenticola sp.]